MNLFMRRPKPLDRKKSYKSSQKTKKLKNVHFYINFLRKVGGLELISKPTVKLHSGLGAESKPTSSVKLQEM